MHLTGFYTNAAQVSSACVEFLLEWRRNALWEAFWRTESRCSPPESRSDVRHSASPALAPQTFQGLRPASAQRRDVHPPLARQCPKALAVDVVGLDQGAIVIGEAGQVGCQVWQRFGDLWRRADRGRATGEIDSVETGPRRLSSAHVAQRPPRTHGDEASHRPPTIEAGGVHL